MVGETHGALAVAFELRSAGVPRAEEAGLLPVETSARVYGAGRGEVDEGPADGRARGRNSEQRLGRGSHCLRLDAGCEDGERGEGVEGDHDWLGLESLVQ